jgi:hypothetical protein
MQPEPQIRGRIKDSDPDLKSSSIVESGWIRNPVHISYQYTVVTVGYVKVRYLSMPVKYRFFASLFL